jgi:hypothetical protein
MILVNEKHFPDALPDARILVNLLPPAGNHPAIHINP